jgi:hypothetical protein
LNFSKVPETDVLDVLLTDPKAAFTRGGVVMAWGDYFPYTHEEQQTKSNPTLSILSEMFELNKEINYDAFQDYIQSKHIITVEEGQTVETPKFNCPPICGKMFLRGSCNSAGRFLEIQEMKKKLQGFKLFMNYMTDQSVVEKINEYLGSSVTTKKMGKFEPAADEFSFSFSPFAKQLPAVLQCDFTYAFVKLLESEPIMKIPMKDVPTSCGSLDICLPYLSKTEIEQMKKVNQVKSVVEIEGMELERELEQGKRCRVYPFGSDDEISIPKEVEHDWFFQNKTYRVAPRWVFKDNDLKTFQEALDDLTEEDFYQIRKMKRTRMNAFRGLE